MSLHNPFGRLEPLSPPPAPVPCERCGASIQARPSLVSGGWFHPPACSACIEREDERAQRERCIAAYQSLLTQSGFPLQVIKEEKARQIALEPLIADFVRAFEAGTPPRCVWLHGVHGGGKTTRAGQAIQRIYKGHVRRHQQDPSPEKGAPRLVYIQEIEAFRRLDDRITSREDREHFEEAIRYAALLCVDEVGRHKGAEWIEPYWHHLLAGRYNHGLPTLFVSNASLQALADSGSGVYEGQLLDRLALDLASHDRHYEQEFTRMWRMEIALEAGDGGAS